MKILLDHNLDRRLLANLPNHEVATTQSLGWSDVLNGELLTLAEQNGFDVLLTADANLRKQQNLTNRDISVVVLRAFNNRLSTHAEMIDMVEAAISTIKRGELIEVFHDEMKEHGGI